MDELGLPPKFFKSAIVDLVWSAYSVTRGIRHSFSPVSALTYDRPTEQANRQADDGAAAQGEWNQQNRQQLG